MTKKKTGAEDGFPPIGSIEDALGEMPAFPFPKGTPEEERKRWRWRGSSSFT